MAKILDFVHVALVVLERAFMLSINVVLYAKLWLSTEKTCDNVQSMSEEALAEPIAIIVPVLNESANIKRMLRNLAEQSRQPSRLHVIVADSGCTDDTMEVAERLSCADDFEPALITTAAEKVGRGAAFRSGLAAIAGKPHSLLLFLHADTLLPPFFDDILRKAFLKPGTLMTAFRQGLHFQELPASDVPPPGINAHTFGNYVKTYLFQNPLGDQAMAIRPDILDRVGGFPDVPIMEDIVLASRVRKLALAGAGRVVTLPECVQTCGRRFLKMPVWLLGFTNQLIILKYNFLGKDPAEIYAEYYGFKEQGA